MKTAIIGLGLIGGSVARRLRGFHDCEIAAYNRSKESLDLALRDGVIDTGTQSPSEAMDGADLIILCLYPQLNVDIIRDNLTYLKDGAVITDVSGVKEFMVEELGKILPDTVDFVGAHPMAGREVGGYKSSTDTLFEKASFIMTPTEKNKPESIALVRELAEYIGCRHVVTTTPKEHDAIIAYTSQLMHVVAVALCDNPMIERSTFFSAGSLRDCTRVAKINEVMWSELFVENKTELSKRIREMEASLEKIAVAVDNSDRAELEKIMSHACAQKLKWLEEKQ
ncbi:MAG: prephenate dehydrogenase/arogenate dehydrogenase family protein [Firmicutes bacterium]|nr:prephenate dehydrogenase/arogenate dehydrogenase family protein [Bacillota bacterium]